MAEKNNSQLEANFLMYDEFIDSNNSRSHSPIGTLNTPSININGVLQNSNHYECLSTPSAVRPTLSSEFYEESYPSFKVPSSWPPTKSCLFHYPNSIQQGEGPKQTHFHNGDLKTLHSSCSTATDEDKSAFEHECAFPAGFSDEADWNRYRSFLFKVWEENSLGNSSLDAESSTSLSFSGEIPFALDLLGMEEVVTSRREETSVHPNKTQYERESSFRKVCNPPNKQRNSSVPNANSQLLSFAEKSSQPHPFANMIKENSQGEVNRGHTLFLRSKPPLGPLLEDADTLPRSYNQDHQLAPSAFKATNKHYREYPTPQKPNPIHSCVFDPHLNTPFSPVTPKTQPQSGCQTGSINRTFDHHRDHRLNQNNDKCLSPDSCDHRSENSKLKNDLEEAKNKILLLSLQMEDQSSHIEQLIEGRKQHQLAHPFHTGYPAPHAPSEMTYPVFPQGYKTPHHSMYPPSMSTYGYNAHQPLDRRSSWQYPCDNAQGQVNQFGYKRTASPEDLVSHLNDPRALESFRDRIVALQMQNIELNLFLNKEQMRRKEAESAVKKEREYVKKLQNSLQDLSTSTLVMDPLTYKQVADKYIASRKKPVRRTHTCNPYMGSSDLVCDTNNTLQVNQNTNKSSSCPSSPLSSNQARKSSVPQEMPQQSTSSPEEATTPPPPQGRLSPPLHVTKPADDTTPPCGGNDSTRETPRLKHEEYQELLRSLDSLEVSSSPS